MMKMKSFHYKQSLNFINNAFHGTMAIALFWLINVVCASFLFQVRWTMYAPGNFVTVNLYGIDTCCFWWNRNNVSVKTDPVHTTQAINTLGWFEYAKFNIGDQMQQTKICSELKCQTILPIADLGKEGTSRNITIKCNQWINCKIFKEEM